MSAASATPVLETQRFTLRPIERADAQALFPTLSDEAQCRYLLQGAFATLEALEAWLFDPDWNGRTWVAVDRKTGDVAARLVTVPVADEVAEIGYITVSEFQGQGVASECAAALVTHLFDIEKLHRITAGSDPRNTASNAILQRLDFTREAHLRQSIKTHIGWCDEYLWGLLRSDWDSA